MNDHPNERPPLGDPPARDPVSAPTRTIGPMGETIAPDDANRTVAAPPAMPDLSIGGPSSGSHLAPEPPKLDGYTVIKCIGEGGMGTVWRGVQLSTKRNVALKLISAAGFASERARQRFDREVEITARLEHPNIARVYDSGINRGIYFYAMELIDGMPLDQHISRKGLGRPDILRLFAIICRAVDHAHQRGVIHRDLKPGNILVSPEGQPHVLDFGLAKALLQAGKEAGISIDGEVAGTPGFMAPEQAAGKSDIDARCDVYSLGVILYRLLTGQSPHDLSGTYLDVLRRISEEDPRRPRLVDKSMDRDLEALLLHAMQREPSARYISAGDMAQDIERYLAGDPISAKPPSTIYYLHKRVRKHRVKLTAVGIVLGLMIAAGILTVKLWKSHQEHVRQELANQKAAMEEERARGKGEVSEGDSEFKGRNWEKARKHYLDALPHFDNANVSGLPAELGLWDLARAAPQAIVTLPPLVPVAKTNGPAANVAVTNGALLFMADGQRALAGCDDGTLRLWDVTTGQMTRLIQAHRGAVRSIGITADGKLAQSAGADGAVILWDLTSGKVVKKFPRPVDGSSGFVTRIALSGDGRLALCAGGASADALQSATYNDTLMLSDTSTGRALHTSDRSAGVLDVKGSITQALFSPDGSKVMTVGAEIVVWSAADGKRITTLAHTAMAGAFSPDGQWIAAGASNGEVHLANLATGETATLPGSGAVSSLSIDTQKDQIITANEDGSFRAMDLHGKERWSLPAVGEISAVALSPDASVALTAADDGVAVWRLAPPPEARELATDGPFPDCVMSRDGRIALSRSARRNAVGSAAQAELWDVATGKKLTPANLSPGHCNGIALSADGRTMARVMGSVLAIASLDPPGEIQRITIKPARSAGDFAPVALSGDGMKVVVGAADNSILLYSVNGSFESRHLAGHEAPVMSLSFSADGRFLLSGSEDHTARLWNTETASLVVVLAAHQAPVNAVAISDDGKTAVTASGAIFEGDKADNSVRVWELPSGKPVFEFPSEAARMRSVAISGDGALIAGGGDDQTVILWDRASGDMLRTIQNLHAPTLSLSFDQTGQTLLCGGYSLSLWKLSRPAEQRRLQPAFSGALAKNASRPLDPADFLALGKWYAFQSEAGWAGRFLRQAREAGQSAPALDLARCDWDRGDFNAAEREMDGVTAQDAPAFYVKLCKEAMRAEKLGRVR